MLEFVPFSQILSYLKNCNIQDYKKIKILCALHDPSCTCLVDDRDNFPITQ